MNDLDFVHISIFKQGLWIALPLMILAIVSSHGRVLYVDSNYGDMSFSVESSTGSGSEYGTRLLAAYLPSLERYRSNVLAQTSKSA